MRTFPAVLLALALAAVAGCSAARNAEPPISTLKGKDVVLILWHDSHFNYTLMEKVTDHVTRKGYKTINDEDYRADLYRASDYAAVVFLVKHEAKGSMKIADAFIKKHGGRGNIVASISHEWDVDGSTIKKSYDAFTAASKDFEQEEILKSITNRLDGMLK